MTWSPASISSWTVQSYVATASSRSTAPSSVTANGSPSKRCSRGPASWRQMSSWWSASTLMPRWPASRSIGHVELVVAMENDTSGGSMLTEVNDDAAMPVSWPFTDAATATTPEGKAPKASRRVRWSSGVRLWGGHADTTWRSVAVSRLQQRARGREPGVVRRGVGVLGVQDEQPAGGHRGAQLDEQRAQRVLHGQRVDRRGAEHQRHGGHPRQALVGEPVEEALEQPRVGRLVRRAGHDEQVAGGHLLDEPGDPGRRRVEQLTGHVGQVDDQVGAAQPVGQRERGLVGARERLGVADDDGDPGGAHETVPRAAHDAARWPPKGTEEVAATGAGLVHTPRFSSSGSTPSPKW